MNFLFKPIQGLTALLPIYDQDIPWTLFCLQVKPLFINQDLISFFALCHLVFGFKRAIYEWDVDFQMSPQQVFLYSTVHCYVEFSLSCYLIFHVCIDIPLWSFFKRFLILMSNLRDYLFASLSFVTSCIIFTHYIPFM